MSHALANRCFTFSPPSAIHLFEGSKPDHTKSWLYAVCSLSYLGAMVSSNSALQYVNYPTQVRPCLLPGHSRSVKTRCLFKIKKYLVLPLPEVLFFCGYRCWGNRASPSQVNIF